jgi:hypothetical protein
MRKEKTGGRLKGTPNKTTSEIRTVLSSFISSNIDTMQQDFDSIDEPVLRLQMMEKLLRYILPTNVKTDFQFEAKEKQEIIITYVDSAIALANSEDEVDLG